MADEFLENLWFVYAKSAPYLVLGLIMAGLLHRYVPPGLISRFVRGGAFVSTLKAAFIGTPVPLCSCGVVPVALSLHREGAGRHSTISFLVATPENGVDSMSLSYSLFGGLFTLVRLIFAIVIAVICGLAVYVLSPRDEGSNKADATKTCCKTAGTKEQVGKAAKSKSSAVYFITNDFLPEIALWIVFGFVASALIATFTPPSLLSSQQGFSSLVAAALVGLPLYVCASASTPIALGLFTAGLSPGACLVFLITGPATNAANIPLYAKEFGVRTTAIFYLTLLLASITIGWLIDQFFKPSDFAVTSFQATHIHGPNLLEWAGIIAFLPMLTYAIWKKLQHN